MFLIATVSSLASASSSEFPLKVSCNRNDSCNIPRFEFEKFQTLAFGPIQHGPICQLELDFETLQTLASEFVKVVVADVFSELQLFSNLKRHLLKSAIRNDRYCHSPSILIPILSGASAIRLYTTASLTLLVLEDLLEISNT